MEKQQYRYVQELKEMMDKHPEQYEKMLASIVEDTLQSQDGDAWIEVEHAGRVLEMISAAIFYNELEEDAEYGKSVKVVTMTTDGEWMRPKDIDIKDKMYLEFTL